METFDKMDIVAIHSYDEEEYRNLTALEFAKRVGYGVNYNVVKTHNEIR